MGFRLKLSDSSVDQLGHVFPWIHFDTLDHGWMRMHWREMAWNGVLTFELWTCGMDNLGIPSKKVLSCKLFWAMRWVPYATRRAPHFPS